VRYAMWTFQWLHSTDVSGCVSVQIIGLFYLPALKKCAYLVALIVAAAEVVLHMRACTIGQWCLARGRVCVCTRKMR
jgi:hypothetical protein